jgi:hypothetical protein
VAEDERQPIVVVLGNDQPVDHLPAREANKGDREAARRYRAEQHAAAEGISTEDALANTAEVGEDERIRVRVDAAHQGYQRRATVVRFPADVGPREALATLLEPTRGIWAHHSDGPAPWVASTSPGLSGLLSDEFGAEVRDLDLDDLESPRKEAEGGRGGAGVDATGGEARGHHRSQQRRDRTWHRRGPGLGPWLGLALLLALTGLWARTAAGRDFQSRVMGDTASTGTGLYAAANYIALSTDATAVAEGAADTTLPGEVTTAGGALGRAQAAYAHTTGTSTYTLSRTYTASSGTGLPVTIAKIGVLNAASGGTLVFQTLITPATATISARGDSLTITETVTI